MFDLQAWLDRAVDSFIAGDEEAFVDMLSLPFSVITGSETTIARAEQDLREAFRSYVASIHEQGVTDLVRVAKQTTMIEPVLAVGVYETHILRRSHRIIDPYCSSVTLRREGEIWRATSMMNAVAHNDWVNRIPAMTPDAGAELRDGTGG
ncbi:MAG: hypothetical protein AAGC86_03855 [Pseudomonadota bacterium]